MNMKKHYLKKTNELKQIFSVVTNKQDFDQTLNSLASAKKEVFDFFDNVKVNDDSEIIKKNRLELLSFFCKTFENFIDFQLIKDANE
jgi:glycyl-tRNA synthetase beta chain